MGFSNYCVELAYDFLSTNYDLMSNNEGKRIKIFGMFPVAYTYGYKLVQAVKSSEYAKSVINQEKALDQSYLNTLRSSYKYNLGKVILKIKSQNKKLKTLDSIE